MIYNSFFINLLYCFTLSKQRRNTVEKCRNTLSSIFRSFDTSRQKRGCFSTVFGHFAEISTVFRHYLGKLCVLQKLKCLTIRCFWNCRNVENMSSQKHRSNCLDSERWHAIRMVGHWGWLIRTHHFRMPGECLSGSGMDFLGVTASFF